MCVCVRVCTTTHDNDLENLCKSLISFLATCEMFRYILQWEEIEYDNSYCLKQENTGAHRIVSKAKLTFIYFI